MMLAPRSPKENGTEEIRADGSCARRGSRLLTSGACHHVLTLGHGNACAQAKELVVGAGHEDKTEVSTAGLAAALRLAPSMAVAGGQETASRRLGRLVVREAGTDSWSYLVVVAMEREAGEVAQRQVGGAG